MLSTIPTGQFIGSTIEHFVFFVAGAYLVFLWPRRIERQVASAKITREEGDAKLKKVRPWFGYFLMVQHRDDLLLSSLRAPLAKQKLPCKEVSLSALWA